MSVSFSPYIKSLYARYWIYQQGSDYTVCYIVHGFIIAKGTNSSFHRSSMGIFFLMLAKLLFCWQYFLSSSFTLFFSLLIIFFMLKSIIVDQSRFLASQESYKLWVAIANSWLPYQFYLQTFVFTIDAKNTDWINPCNWGTKPNSSFHDAWAFSVFVCYHTYIIFIYFEYFHLCKETNSVGVSKWKSFIR